MVQECNFLLNSDATNTKNLANLKHNASLMQKGFGKEVLDIRNSMSTNYYLVRRIILASMGVSNVDTNCYGRPQRCVEICRRIYRFEMIFPEVSPHLPIVNSPIVIVTNSKFNSDALNSRRPLHPNHVDLTAQQ